MLNSIPRMSMSLPNDEGMPELCNGWGGYLCQVNQHLA